jgi:hypothetical protein
LLGRRGASSGPIDFGARLAGLCVRRWHAIDWYSEVRKKEYRKEVCFMVEGDKQSTLARLLERMDNSPGFSGLGASVQTVAPAPG